MIKGNLVLGFLGTGKATSIKSILKRNTIKRIDLLSCLPDMNTAITYIYGSSKLIDE